VPKGTPPSLLCAISLVILVSYIWIAQHHWQQIEDSLIVMMKNFSIVWSPTSSRAAGQSCSRCHTFTHLFRNPVSNSFLKTPVT
jgi:hypothetical protein